MRADGSLDNITETANDKSAGSVHRMITREEHSETAWSATNMSEPNHEIPSEIGAAICSKKDSKIDRGKFPTVVSWISVRKEQFEFFLYVILHIWVSYVV